MGYSLQTLHMWGKDRGDLISKKKREKKGWEKKGGGNYIPNVAIGARNRALIGIDQVCCKSPEGKNTYPIYNRLSSTPISSVNAYVFKSNNANGVWLISNT